MLLVVLRPLSLASEASLPMAVLVGKEDRFVENCRLGGGKSVLKFVRSR